MKKVTPKQGAVIRVAQVTNPRTKRDVPKREPEPDPEPLDPAEDLTMEGPMPEEPDQRELETGVIQSADWEFDDDPASYSAPI